MLLKALERRAREYKLTPTIGRSHGIHAEPTTFGLKLAQAYAEFARAKERLIAARAEVATCVVPLKPVATSPSESSAVTVRANVLPAVTLVGGWVVISSCVAALAAIENYFARLREASLWTTRRNSIAAALGEVL